MQLTHLSHMEFLKPGGGGAPFLQLFICFFPWNYERTPDRLIVLHNQTLCYTKRHKLLRNKGVQLGHLPRYEPSSPLLEGQDFAHTSTRRKEPIAGVDSFIPNGQSLWRGPLMKLKETLPLKSNDRSSFDPKIFLDKIGERRTITEYRKNQVVFSQGDPADAIFYIQKGKVKLPSCPNTAKKPSSPFRKLATSSARGA